MPEGREDLYQASSVGQSARQINDDPDLYGILIDVYEKLGRGDRAKRLRSQARRPKDFVETTPELGISLTKNSRADMLRSFLSSDKDARREFAVRARKFLSERKAGRSVEEQRLRRGRAAQIVEKSRRVQDASLASPMLTSRGRVRSLLDENILGAQGTLG